MKSVISQPMYFPWVGFIEQLKIANNLIIYDDIQFSKGSFCNRVQIKTASGVSWLTVPLEKFKLGQSIDEVKISKKTDWKSSQIAKLTSAYNKSPYFNEMLSLVEDVFSNDYTHISDLSQSSTMAIMDYFSLNRNLRVEKSKLDFDDKAGSERVLLLSKKYDTETYITGHGAKNYLNHDDFEKNGIKVKYMDYNKNSYPQLHGPFIPYVSSLDLIANCGPDGAHLINSQASDWRIFLNEPKKQI